MPHTLSVIIPALNEARTLPGLLEALRGQTRPPDEVIVADAGSADDTAAVAQAGGARVVPGGTPAAGRNAGATAASGDLLLFLDADVLPESDFVERLTAGLVYFGLDVATCLVTPLSERAVDRLAGDASNLYLQMVQSVSPRALGCCILARREAHQAIGGFDETVMMSEDHDYVQRAARRGEFAVLTNVSIPVSMRRLEKEGLVRLAFKYLYCEMHALAGQPIHAMPFVYEFGNYAERPQRSLVDISWLRRQLVGLENPLSRLSDGGLASLRSLGRMRLTGDRFRQHIGALLPEEVASLDDYLRQRLELMRGRSADFWQAARKRLQAAGPFERLRLEDEAAGTDLPVEDEEAAPGSPG